MADKSLVSIEQKDVAFYEDVITAVRGDDGHIYISLRNLCDALGIDVQAQTRRIRRRTVLEHGLQRVAILTTHRGPQQTYVLRVDLVPLFLAGISSKSVAETARPKLERFQEEAAKVLWEAFQEGRLTAEIGLDDLLAGNTPAAQAYKMAEAIMKMARQQLLLESRLESHTSQLAAHEQRLEAIEGQLGSPEQFVTPEQAMQISQAVKAVAYELGKRSKRNEYGGVYGELYRRYGINSYKSLPKSKFEDALKWLNEWLQSLVGSAPF